MHADPEFEKLKEKLLWERQTTVILTATDDHVSEAERKNHVVQERADAVCHKVPC